MIFGHVKPVNGITAVDDHCRSRRRLPWHIAGDDSEPAPYHPSHYETSLQRHATNKGKNGALEPFTAMPVDIVYEVFNHLSPLDLLNLSRTTHRLRDILMTRDARSVWKSSFSNVRGLPFCPSDMTEPQYARLAFDECCHFCHKPGVKDAFWSCLVRCCKKCMKDQFVTQEELHLLVPDGLSIKRPEAIFPYIIYPKSTARNPSKVMYYLPIAERYIEELEEIAQTGDEVSLNIWSRDKKIVQAERLTHATLCERWAAYWAFPGSQEFDIAIMIFLIALLILLWKDTIFGS